MITAAPAPSAWWSVCAWCMAWSDSVKASRRQRWGCGECSQDLTNYQPFGGRLLLWVYPKFTKQNWCWTISTTFPESSNTCFVLIPPKKYNIHYRVYLIKSWGPLQWLNTQCRHHYLSRLLLLLLLVVCVWCLRWGSAAVAQKTRVSYGFIKPCVRDE